MSYRNILARQNRDISAAFYQANPAAVHRLVPWIRREIVALFGARDMNFVNSNTSLIIEHVEQSGIKSKRIRVCNMFNMFFLPKMAKFLTQFF